MSVILDLDSQTTYYFNISLEVMDECNITIIYQHLDDLKEAFLEKSHNLSLNSDPSRRS